MCISLLCTQIQFLVHGTTFGLTWYNLVQFLPDTTWYNSYMVQSGTIPTWYNLVQFPPGTTATVFKARSTRNVLKAARFPIGKANVIYLRKTDNDFNDNITPGTDEWTSDVHAIPSQRCHWGEMVSSHLWFPSSIPSTVCTYQDGTSVSPTRSIDRLFVNIIINNNKVHFIFSIWHIRTCYTLLYIVQQFLTFADVIDENHELIFFFNSIDGAWSSADYFELLQAFTRCQGTIFMALQPHRTHARETTRKSSQFQASRR